LVFPISLRLLRWLLGSPIGDPRHDWDWRKSMTPTAQLPQGDACRTDESRSADTVVDHPPKRAGLPVHTRTVPRTLLSLSILVGCLLLWFVGADWRTLVMVAAGASILAIASEQLETMLRR
jgi:hypothetical protein